MRWIEIEVDGVSCQAELLETVAPRTAAAFWEALPLTTRLTHSQWSGPACLAGIDLPNNLELERPVCSIYPGTLVVRPHRGELLIGYGSAEYRSAAGVEYATRVARLIGDRQPLLAALAEMHDRGDRNITIRRSVVNESSRQRG
jgi:hypothetical protein